MAIEILLSRFSISHENRRFMCDQRRNLKIFTYCIFWDFKAPHGYFSAIFPAVTLEIVLNMSGNNRRLLSLGIFPLPHFKRECFEHVVQ